MDVVFSCFLITDSWRLNYVSSVLENYLFVTIIHEILIDEVLGIGYVFICWERSALVDQIFLTIVLFFILLFLEKVKSVEKELFLLVLFQSCSCYRVSVSIVPKNRV